MILFSSHFHLIDDTFEFQHWLGIITVLSHTLILVTITPNFCLATHIVLYTTGKYLLLPQSRTKISMSQHSRGLPSSPLPFTSLFVRLYFITILLLIDWRDTFIWRQCFSFTSLLLAHFTSIRFTIVAYQFCAII